MRKTIIVIIMLLLLLTGCMNESPNKEETKEENNRAYTADNVYQWLNESNLLEGEKEPLSESVQSHEQFVNGYSTGDIDIIEYETAEGTEQLKEHPIALVHENIVLMFLGQMSQKDSFKAVLEARKPLEGLYRGYFNSAEQQSFVHQFRDGKFNGFEETVDHFYKLEDSLKSDTFTRFMYQKEVTWKGKLVQTFPDFLVVYASGTYNGENWLNIETNSTEMLPYTFVVETQNLEGQSLDLKMERGDSITVKGKINKQGSLERETNWGLENGLVIQ
ncbi:hypothetical protein DXT76_09110 [Halobacillus trueperi]|uniref:Lipoprotein n=1 Tax=Halobacillus trueperi TaxID=156205 RepID=A0A3D8VNY9_9BACI|nr:hypothetical protein [Halobacillus trueperi]RDY71114.1 hypothetical protein DXT76_09110 [Halobacillus trueperi]